MITYDDKTEGILELEGRFILPLFSDCESATFKASYIVASDIKCKGKITALFDLIVLGNIYVSEIDVKGKFVCLGNCEVQGSIVVQNEIWANDIQAMSIETRDKIIAQDVDAETIIADDGMIIGKILAVEKLAKSEKNILCGETAYGAGKISANSIITVEPLDLDDGEDAVISPNKYVSGSMEEQIVPANNNTIMQTNLISYGETEYAPQGNYKDFLEQLSRNSYDEDKKIKFARWANHLSEAESIIQTGIDEQTNLAILIWLSEITGSEYFKSWDKISELYNAFERHFKNMIHMDKNSVDCVIENYSDWLEVLAILNRFGRYMEDRVYDIAYELVVSNLGLKAKFVSERLLEKGWKTHGEQ